MAEAVLGLAKGFSPPCTSSRKPPHPHNATGEGQWKPPPFDDGGRHSRSAAAEELTKNKGNGRKLLTFGQNDLAPQWQRKPKEEFADLRPLRIGGQLPPEHLLVEGGPALVKAAEPVQVGGCGG